MYIDPWIYERPEDALCEFASELDPSSLFLEIMIGGGTVRQSKAIKIRPTVTTATVPYIKDTVYVRNY